MTDTEQTFEGYCLKCKGKKLIVNAEKSAFKNGTPIMKGTCEGCEGILQRIIARDKN